MRTLELTPIMTGEIEESVYEFLAQRGAVYADDEGVVRISKEHSFTYHEVLMLLTGDV